MATHAWRISAKRMLHGVYVLRRFKVRTSYAAYLHCFRNRAYRLNHLDDHLVFTSFMDLPTFINALPPWTELRSDQYPHNDLGHFHDGLMSRPPKRASSIIALRPRDSTRIRRGEPGSMFLVIGRFRTEYSLITEVARSIARAIVITGNVPVIRPIHEAELVEMPEDAFFAESIRLRGARLWRNSDAAKP